MLTFQVLFIVAADVVNRVPGILSMAQWEINYEQHERVNPSAVLQGHSPIKSSSITTMMEDLRDLRFGDTIPFA